MNQSSRWLSRPYIFKLFLLSVFPIHLWAILLYIIEFPIPRTSSIWDSIAIGCYIVVFAFFESAVFFIWLYLLNFLLPKDWEERKKLGALNLLYFQVMLIALIGQLFHLIPINFKFLEDILLAYPRPFVLEVIIMGLIGLINGGIALRLIFSVNKNDKLTSAVNRFIDNLSTLSVLYLMIDLASFVYIVIRNL